MSSTDPASAQPPIARKVPQTRTHHGDEFVDHYEWLRDKDNPEVIEHLKAENFYTEALTQHQEQLRTDIFNEIKNRTQETDLSVPGRKGAWWYYSRTVEGSQYPIYCRTAAQDTGDIAADWTPPAVDPSTPVPGEIVLLDCNAEAEGKPFFALGGFSVSEDGDFLTYSVDNTGDERFTQYVKVLRTGELLFDTIPDVFYGGAFSPDGRSIFYTVVDESWRPYQVRRHTLGTQIAEDTVVFTEDDPGMWVGFDVSSNRNYLVIGSGCSEYSELRLLDLRRPDAELQTIISRDERILYEAEPVTLAGVDKLVLVHNRDAVNSMVSLMDVSDAGEPLAEQHWTTVIPHNAEVRINGAGITSTHLVVSLRKDTTERVQIIPLAALEAAEGDAARAAGAVAVEPAFDEQLYTCHVSAAEFEAPVLRLSYTSFVTPPRVYDYFPAAAGEPAERAALHLRKETPVLGGYDAGRYVAERDWAVAADGTRIPLSIIRRADLKRDGTNPVLQYAYGSYEVSMDPGFSIARLSVLDRGIIFVIAHIRGGGEMGRHWYENGKKLYKKNTFTDFVDATDHIAASGWADPTRIAAMGGSAGGLLMGAVANLAPEKYRAIVAQVPFVDALTTILDPDLPLSALEWEEWGNPITDPEVYHYMKSYSPYENVRPVAYPAIAAVTSLNDTRVLYVEPAKWVARLREVSTGSKPIVLKTEMDGGHGGPSGRYEKWKDVAWDYAFVVDALTAR